MPNGRRSPVQKATAGQGEESTKDALYSLRTATQLEGGDHPHGESQSKGSQLQSLPTNQPSQVFLTASQVLSSNRHHTVLQQHRDPHVASHQLINTPPS